MIVKLMKDLDNSSNEVLSKHIIDNATKEYELSSPDGGVVAALIQHYSRIDHVLKSNGSTFEKELSNLSGTPLR
jgi:hypothetical protein